MLVDKYRPKNFSEITGLASVKAFFECLDLEEKEIPHRMLFSGPNGVGKSSVARILANSGNLVSIEIDAATDNGVDNVRDWTENIDLPNLTNIPFMYILDEAHQLTNAAQNALLKPVEDKFKRDYIILVTTDPSKIIKGLRQRLIPFEFKSHSKNELIGLLRYVTTLENRPLEEQDLERLVDNTGSARIALQRLEVFLETGTINDSLDGESPELKNLYQALWDPKISNINPIIRELTEEPESIRIGLINIFNYALLNGKINAMEPIFQLTQKEWIGPGRFGLQNATLWYIKEYLNK